MSIDPSQKSSLPIKKIFIFLLLLIGLILLYARFIEPSWLRVVNITVPLSEEQRDLDGVQLFHVSDVHPKAYAKFSFPAFFTIWNSREKNPEFAFYTGDIQELPDVQLPALDIVDLVNADRKLVVLGEQEFDSGVDLDYYKERLDQEEGLLLRNQCRVFELSSSVSVTGVEKVEWKAGELSGVAEACDSNYKILLSHDPSIFDHSDIEYFDLVLSGKCHGGQVNLPFIGPLYKPEGCEEYDHGTFRKGKTLLSVSGGLGMAKWPFRLGARPELIIYTLKYEAN